MSKDKYRINENSGMTLIEILIAMVILALLGLGLVSLQYILSQNKILVINSYRSVDEANSILSSFTREIRSAKESDNGAYPLANVDDQQIAFYSDIDYDGLTEKVRYFLQGMSLIKGVIKETGYPPQYLPANEKTTVLSDNIKNATLPVFYYYNSSWPQDTTNNPLSLANRLSETRTVKIYLKVNNTNSIDKDYILESFTQIRMLKNNL